MTVDFPTVTRRGVPITERILTEFSDRNFGGATPFSLPLSGSPRVKLVFVIRWQPDQSEPLGNGADVPRAGSLALRSVNAR